MSYRSYDAVIEKEKKLGLYQPKDDRELLVPLKPLPGIYSGTIWDIIEAHDKIIIRFELYKDGKAVLYDWEVWAKDKTGRTSYQLSSLFRLFRVSSPAQLINIKIGEAQIDPSGNISFRSR